MNKYTFRCIPKQGQDSMDWDEFGDLILCTHPNEKYEMEFSGIGKNEQVFYGEDGKDITEYMEAMASECGYRIETSIEKISESDWERIRNG